MKAPRLIVMVALLLLLGTAVLFSQDLLRTNPNYIKARELQLRAGQAYEAGEYDKAVEYADEAQRLSALAEGEAAARLLQLRANGWKNQAERRLRYAEGLAADRRYPEEYARARGLFATAQTAYNAGDYQLAMDSARTVVAILEDIEPK